MSKKAEKMKELWKTISDVKAPPHLRITAAKDWRNLGYDCRDIDDEMYAHFQEVNQTLNFGGANYGAGNREAFDCQIVAYYQILRKEGKNVY